MHRHGQRAYVSNMRLRITLALLLLLGSAHLAMAAPPPAAAVASAHPQATAAGREILAAGGNAFDAAVAVAAALAVVEPFNSGLGGGGLFLLHRASDGKEVMLDARERAPLAATRNMYLDEDGEPRAGASVNGALAAAIPGLPAGLTHLARHYGKLPLTRTLAPAIQLARNGFVVTPRYRQYAQERHDALLHSAAASVAFLDGGFVPDNGFVIRQPDLAVTLTQLARHGDAAFYRGRVAAKLVAGVRAAGGIWSREDLQGYRVVERAPVRGTYRGVRITTAALPSSGGIVLLQMLGMIEGFDLAGATPALRAHLVIEAMRRAYRDRALHLGDPDFVRDSAARLLDPGYIARLWADIDPRSATPSAALAAPVAEGSAHTTHFSVIDRAGNRVAATVTINTAFGAAFVPPGTGVLLNNEMDDFAAKPGVPNAYGLVGADANAIAPGKRPLSSMTPTFVESADRVLVIGTPGGSRITTMVLLATLDFIEGRGGVEDWVARPRYHHQYLPDVVTHEADAFSADAAAELTRMGHSLRVNADGYGNMQALVWFKDTGRVEAASDPRGEGRVWVEGIAAGRVRDRGAASVLRRSYAGP